MFTRFNPYRAIALNHPMFAFERSRLHWGDNPERLRVGTRRFLLMTTLLALVAWVVMVAISYDGNRDFLMYDAGALGYLFFASLGSNILIDLMAMHASISSINGDLTAGRWDLLRLTLLKDCEVVAAKASVAWLRSWRFLLLVLGLRLGVVLVFIVQTTLYPVLIGQPDDSLPVELWDELFYQPVETSLSLLALVLFVVIYLLEPLLRLRALTGLGLLLSTYVRHTVTVWLVGVGAIIAVWLTQVALGAGLIAGALWVGERARRLLLTSYYMESTIVLVGVVTSLTALLFIYYGLMQRLSLHHTIRRLPKVSD